MEEILTHGEKGIRSSWTIRQRQRRRAFSATSLYLLLQDYELFRRPDAFPSKASQFLRVIQLKTCRCCVPPSTCWKRKWQFPAQATKKTRTLKNVAQRCFTSRLCSSVAVRNPCFGDFLNPESGNRDPGTGDGKKSDPGYFNSFGLKILKLFVNSTLADLYPGSGTLMTPGSVIRDPRWKKSGSRIGDKHSVSATLFCSGWEKCTYNLNLSQYALRLYLLYIFATL